MTKLIKLVYSFRINWHSSPSPPLSVSGSPASWQAAACEAGKKSHPAPVRSALELLRAVFSPHCSSPCTWMTAHLKTPLSSSWNLQIIQDADESAYRQEVKELAVWCSLNNLELKTLKTGETPLLSPRSPSWIALWLQWSHSDSWAPHTYFFISNLHMSDLIHDCLYCIFNFWHFVHCPFVYLYIVLFFLCPVLSCHCHCHSVALWNSCHYNKFLVCENIPGQ